MAVVDWVILAVLVLAVFGAARRGFLVEAFSLAGILAGLLLASWNYNRLAPWFAPWTHPPGLASAAAFLLIALGVMVLAGILGRIIRWMVRSVGLGWADRFLGAVFGLVKGCMVLTLVAMAVTAFLPGADWLRSSMLAPYFLRAARQTAVVTPADLGRRIRQGADYLRQVRQEWIDTGAQPGTGPRQDKQ